jgi:uncharacterized repeat protein (TIGR03803 family)
METNFFIRNSIVVLLAWLTLLGWAVSHTAEATVEFQLIQSLGKRDGTPYGKLVRDVAGNLYGTTSDGGSNAAGTIFKLKPSGEITVLHEFDGAGGGASPSGLIQGNDGSFYGTTAHTSNGGEGDGTVFKLDSSGSFSVLHSFDESGAAYPSSGLVQGSDGSLYGTFTFLGSYAFYGGVFKIDAAGSFSILHSFDGNDGGGPYAGLIQGSDGSFYGTTGYGGSYGAGTVFKIDASGNFSVLHELDGSGGGAYPSSALVQSSDGSFYGTTSGGGSANSGTLFKLDPTGNFSILYSFDYTSESGTNPFRLIQGADGLFYGFTTISGDSDGIAIFKFDASTRHFSVLHSFDVISDAEMFQGSDGSFYGTTSSGGSNGTGMVFKLDPSGSFSVIHSFDEIYGVNPYSGLIQSKDGNFYGTTNSGGIYSNGTIFKLDLAGNLSFIHSFDGSSNDGGWPYAGLIQGSDGSFYGTTFQGGSNASGTVFKLDPDGNFSVLHSFDENTGTLPHAGLVEGSDGSFYGTAYYGGSYGNGTVFKLDPSSNDVTVLHEFDGINGANPNAGLIQASDGNFYGTTVSGGSNAAGTVFKIDPSGNFTVLHSFDGNDGSGPYAGLIQGSDGSFYGTTIGGGIGFGTVFKLDMTGNINVLYSFDGADGNGPNAGVIEANDGSFYGTTTNGGSSNLGTIFKLDPDGNFSVLHSFDGNTGRLPYAGLIQASDGSFYGTTFLGGQYDGGVIYRLIETPNAAPIVLESSANPSLRGQRVTFTATVTGNSPTGSVRFLKGTKSLGSAPLIGGVAKLSTSRLKIGSHSITAVYSGDANNASVTSAPIVQVVKAVTKKELRVRPRGDWGRADR